MERKDDLNRESDIRSFPIGEKYNGPPKADPSKPKEDRHKELLELVQTPEGKAIVDRLFMEYHGNLDFTGTAPIGTPVIASILNHEYPEL